MTINNNLLLLFRSNRKVQSTLKWVQSEHQTTSNRIESNSPNESTSAYVPQPTTSSFRAFLQLTTDYRPSVSSSHTPTRKAKCASRRPTISARSHLTRQRRIRAKIKRITATYSPSVFSTRNRSRATTVSASPVSTVQMDSRASISMSATREPLSAPRMLVAWICWDTTSANVSRLVLVMVAFVSGISRLMPMRFAADAIQMQSVSPMRADKRLIVVVIRVLLAMETSVNLVRTHNLTRNLR